MNDEPGRPVHPAADGVRLETSIGYLLKEVASALRTSMEEVLRPLGMNVTRYATLELLSQRPGLSGAALARGTFVTRQSMNAVLQILEDEGWVRRAPDEAAGRVIPTTLTPAGRDHLSRCSVAVRSVEERMLAGLTDDDRRETTRVLRRMRDSLLDPTAQDEGRAGRP